MSLKFIRFGEIPENERSMIHYAYGDTSKSHEDGVSVYPTFWDDSKKLWILDCRNQRGECKDNASSHYSRLSHNWTRAYLVTGDIIGRGTDLEPLLKNVKIIKELKCKDIFVPDYNYDKLEHCEQSINGGGIGESTLRSLVRSIIESKTSMSYEEN